ncbi:hypothetical protein [Pseudorhodoferax sp. Leaf267]|uniref:hypothetical protein n=1 Tax=Pseudorhodoferax sp. Leaf267 TaxID=1736316 RepID=UPI000A579B49|nr:hypothetical protein [Pseudorhodoferax sp. Leaf267]
MPLLSSMPHPRAAGRSLLLGAVLVLSTGLAAAASSKGCEGGGFRVLGLSGKVDTTVPASAVAARFLVQGKYVQFEVDAASFGIRNYVLTGAANPLDMTGGVPTTVFAAKLPDHRGATLTSGVDVELNDEGIELMREGPQVTMKLQAKDCASGGVFQMEVERVDETSTVFTHTLATNPGNPTLSTFYFDNRNFRNREGDAVPYKDTTVVVTPRINFGNDYSAKLVGRDSPQVATRIPDPTCVNGIFRRNGTIDNVAHCGLTSRWDVASGGRMGMVFGEDATEVAPPATLCTHQCQAQNRVKGRSTVLGFPFLVAPGDRLMPRR